MPTSLITIDSNMNLRIKAYCLTGFAILQLSGTALSSTPHTTTVFLWPQKVKEFEGKPTEKVFIKKRRKKNDDTLRLSPIYSPSITVYHAPASQAPGPAILICPGGGYQLLAINKTGTDIAEWCTTNGVTGIVLKYSVPQMKDEALKDIQRAMGVIRQNAKAWNINPKQLGVMGFSAGAHLSARLASAGVKRTYPQVDEADKLSCLPDYCMLMTPAWLDGDMVTPTTPPTFIVQNRDDPFFKPTPSYVEALKKNRIPHETHYFDKGGHGAPLPPSKLAISAWPGLCMKWLKQTLPTLKSP